MERYLRGFDELAHLTISGSYHEIGIRGTIENIDDSEDEEYDALHLFGVTSADPPIYYYRRVENAHYGAAQDKNEGDLSNQSATHWGPWEKLDIQIPVRKVSPLVHNGQLYIFWCRYTTKPHNKLDKGTSTLDSYEHSGYVEYSKRRLDGSWTTPQMLRLDNAPFHSNIFPTWYREKGLIVDPVLELTSSSDAESWKEPSNYSTIQSVTVQDKLYLLGRADEGINTWKYDPETDHWEYRIIEKACVGEMDTCL